MLLAAASSASSGRGQSLQACIEDAKPERGLIACLRCASGRAGVWPQGPIEIVDIPMLVLQCICDHTFACNALNLTGAFVLSQSLSPLLIDEALGAMDLDAGLASIEQRAGRRDGGVAAVRAHVSL